MAQPSADVVHLQILGPLRLWRDGVERGTGPRQQSYLLGLLLACAGRPVGIADLIAYIWDDNAPATAVNIIHKYVGALRRILEPSLRPREDGSFLHRHGSGYRLTASPGTLDLASFREHVEAARAHVARGEDQAGLDRYLRALALWRGPAGDGLPHGSSSVALFTALANEFFDACVAAADLAAQLGRSQRVLPALRLAATMAPLHETVQAGLVTALGAAGQQAEALAVFRAVRTRLADNLGIDPGYLLQTAHRAVLHQTLAPPGRAVATAPLLPPPAPAPAPEALPDSLVGRTEELAVLHRAAEAAFTGGTGLVIVQGEPGVGKTRLLREFTAEAEQRGALVVRGHCLDGEATPSMWPWVQAVGAVLDSLPGPERQKWIDGDLGRLVERDDSPQAPALPKNSTRFLVFEQVVAVVGRAAQEQPVLLTIDDLQWSDIASLQLFNHLTAHLPGRTMVIGALRDRAPAPGSALTRILAAASRVPGHRRLHLGPLDQAEVAELIRRETGQDPSPEAARRIHHRTAGNPFFVQELSRLLADTGLRADDTTVSDLVPATVQDIVRTRMADLDDNGRLLLQVAALIGRDVDLGLLADAAGIDIPACLDLLESLEALALLEPDPDNPFAFRFAHDIVRESIAGTTPPSRVPHLHFRVAEALEHTGREDESLAYHLWASGPLADPARTAAALIRAAHRAASKSAWEAAKEQLASAAAVARTAGLAEVELSALSSLTVVLSRQVGSGGSTVELFERAEHLARALGREAETAGFLCSRVIGAHDALQADRGRLARRLHDQGTAAQNPNVRAWAHLGWALHQWDAGAIGESARHFARMSRLLPAADAGGEAGPLPHELRLRGRMWQAVVTALHGDPQTAQVLLDHEDAGTGPYAVATVAHYSAMIAAMAGDPAAALRAVERWLAVDPENVFHIGVYLRQSWCWARALTGDDPAAAAEEAERILLATLVDPPHWGVAFHYALIAEMWLAAGRPDDARTALNRADRALDDHGQRYAEGLILLIRARVHRAGGEAVTVVRAAARRAQALSTEREAHLFARRAEDFLAT